MRVKRDMRDTRVNPAAPACDMTIDTNTRCDTVDQRIATIAIRQGGVVASWQLRQAGGVAGRDHHGPDFLPQPLN